LLHAFIVGVETSCRVGLAVMPTHYRRGWHITATCGIFGAAAACARLFGLDAQRTAWALGHPATQSASLVEGIGSMTKSLGVGNAAKNGLAAALFADGRFSGPESPIEGRYGFAAVTSDSADLARITDGIGRRWEVLNNAYKPYPCGVVLFPVIDACLELRARLAPKMETIDRVVVRGHPLMRERTDRPNVETGRDARACSTPSRQRSSSALLGSRNMRTIASLTRPCARCAQESSSKKIRRHRSSRRPSCCIWRMGGSKPSISGTAAARRVGR